LIPGSPNPHTAQRIAAFRDGFGFRESAEIEIVARYADNQLDRLPGLAHELVEGFERSPQPRQLPLLPREEQHPLFRSLRWT